MNTVVMLYYIQNLQYKIIQYTIIIKILLALEIHCNGVRHKTVLFRTTNNQKAHSTVLNAIPNGRFYTIRVQHYDEEKPHRAYDNYQATMR